MVFRIVKGDPGRGMSDFGPETEKIRHKHE